MRRGDCWVIAWKQHSSREIGERTLDNHCDMQLVQAKHTVKIGTPVSSSSVKHGFELGTISIAGLSLIETSTASPRSRRFTPPRLPFLAFGSGAPKPRA